jgi:hypothetical protein
MAERWPFNLSASCLGCSEEIAESRCVFNLKRTQNAFLKETSNGSTQFSCTSLPSAPTPSTMRSRLACMHAWHGLVTTPGVNPRNVCTGATSLSSKCGCTLTRMEAAKQMKGRMYLAQGSMAHICDRPTECVRTWTRHCPNSVVINPACVLFTTICMRAMHVVTLRANRGQHDSNQACTISQNAAGKSPCSGNITARAVVTLTGHESRKENKGFGGGHALLLTGQRA